MEEIIHKFGEHIYGNYYYMITIYIFTITVFNLHKRNWFCLHFYFGAQFSCEMTGVEGHYLCTVMYGRTCVRPYNLSDFFASWGRGEGETLSIHVVSTQCASGLSVMYQK